MLEKVVVPSGYSEKALFEIRLFFLISLHSKLRNDIHKSATKARHSIINVEI